MACHTTHSRPACSPFSFTGCLRNSVTNAEASCCDMPLLVSMQPFYAGEQSGWAMREVLRVGLDTHYDSPEPRLCCFIVGTSVVRVSQKVINDVCSPPLKHFVRASYVAAADSHTGICTRVSKSHKSSTNCVNKSEQTHVHRCGDGSCDQPQQHAALRRVLTAKPQRLPAPRTQGDSRELQRR